MVKVSFNPRTTAYPMPVVLVGATVDGRPNYMAVAWFSKVNSNPPHDDGLPRQEAVTKRPATRP